LDHTEVSDMLKSVKVKVLILHSNNNNSGHLTISVPIPLRLCSLLRTECQSARMSNLKNSGLDQYGSEPFKQQQEFATGGIEVVK